MKKREIYKWLAKVSLKAAKKIADLGTYFLKQEEKLSGAEEKRAKAWHEAARRANTGLYLVGGYPILAKSKRHAKRKFDHLVGGGIQLSMDRPQ